MWGYLGELQGHGYDLYTCSRFLYQSTTLEQRPLGHSENYVKLADVPVIAGSIRSHSKRVCVTRRRRLHKARSDQKWPFGQTRVDVLHGSACA
jgi:hypothetical protein